MLRWRPFRARVVPPQPRYGARDSRPRLASGRVIRTVVLASALLHAPAALAAEVGRGRGPSEVVFLSQIIVLLLVGRLLGEAMQRIGQPAVMGQLLAGILLGPSVLGALWPEAQHALFPPSADQKSMIDAVSQLGILMLLLLTGMETDLEPRAPVAPRRPQRLGRRHRRAVRLRLRARRVPAGGDAAATRAAAHHLAVPRHRAVDLLGQDRRDGGARDELHAPQRRPGDRRLGDHRRHDRLDHHRDHVRHRPARQRRPAVARPEPRSARRSSWPSASRSAAGSSSG